MRPIDADALIESFKSLAVESNNLREKAIIERILHEIAPQIVRDEPTLMEGHDETKES